MLVDTLREISNMSAFSKKALASKMNTSEDVIEQVLEQLKRMKYISEENNEASCSSGCKSCHTTCSPNPINTLTITEKGRKLLNSN
ncbi:FeoC like transcriptional regulator [Gottschalkia purinilytica]|uniref:FeoC like transcriptional regulator n=1 Tax=Gottschalkia purinilytica TaxID=1503 RepID=A0A0L0W6Q5_GOTPU|nr:FeoC-like transcriptional regulator [Gottschalkia purinilytica]KNF07228.1 FeoC like transcriptional regulator [Gottschalkia purinilytica]